MGRGGDRRVGALTKKELLWLACPRKTCCYTPVVVPTGRDVWRISRALDTPPWTFLRYFEVHESRRDAFALDGSARRFRIALAKGHARRKGAPPPCIALMRTRDGSHRCGLGTLRPLVCRAFPSEPVDGLLYLRPDNGCTCREWSLAHVDIAEETALVQAREAESEEYCGVVARWNERLASFPAGAYTDFPAYCNHILDTYDELDARARAEAPP